MMSWQIQSRDRSGHSKMNNKLSYRIPGWSALLMCTTWCTSRDIEYTNLMTSICTEVGEIYHSNRGSYKAVTGKEEGPQ